MSFFYSRLTRRKSLYLALVSSILLFNMESVFANNNLENENKNNIDLVNKKSIQLPKNKICPSENLLPVRSFTTAKYYIYICRGDNQNSLGYYVRIPKSLDNKITLPITEKARETYIALNKQLKYIINPYEMIVIKRRKIILREKVIAAIKANGEYIAKGCLDGNTTFARAETKSFFVYICGSENPNSYVSVTRKNNRRVNLPLKKWAINPVNANRYVATKGNINFVLTDKLLKVSRNGRNIVKEKVLNWE